MVLIVFSSMADFKKYFGQDMFIVSEDLVEIYANQYGFTNNIGVKKRKQTFLFTKNSQLRTRISTDKRARFKQLNTIFA